MAPAPASGLLVTFTLSLLIAFSSSSELDILLTFKSGMEDPTSALSGWSLNSSDHHCNWTGVTCSEASLVASLDLHGLNLSGEISPSVCKLPRLSSLNLAHNYFNQTIPLHLSQCTGLLALNLCNNLLWGTLPEQIDQLSALTSLDLSRNRIEGQIPLSLGSLGALQVLNLASNSFSGVLHPSAFANLSELVVIDLSQNPSLTSNLPREIGKLARLRRIVMQRSGLLGGIPQSLLGLHDLEVLDLSQNNLTGGIPSGFALALPKLVSVDFSENSLTGSFPSDVCYGKALMELNLHGNSFTGMVPKSIEQCSRLQRLQVQDNGFSGELPAGLWSLPDIKVIRVENNQFSGDLPDFIGVRSSLEQIQIDNNSFSGRIPRGLGLIKTMYKFSASHNSFSGNLPDDLCDSSVMSIINLSQNSLSGTIPELRECKKLVSISLADNNFTGNIPSSLGHLPVLTYIDLSSNMLTGPIPTELQNLKLALFNVSFNQLSGSVPLPLVSGLPASYLQGNPGLCGPGMPNPCNPSSIKRSRKNNGLTLVIIVISFVAGLIVLAAGFYIMYKLSHAKSNSDVWKSVFFYPLRITEEELMVTLVEKTVIGEGAFGKVHLVRLPGGDFIVVKRLMNPGMMSFRKVKAEIRTLAKARHRNIAKLLGFYYTEDSILLIQEYLQKGSLGDALRKSGFSMDWKTRLRVAIGSAQGLMYLHKDYVPHVLHRNVKSNNILLDDDFEPKLTGFGIDRVIGETPYKMSMTSELGCCCYMPSEYGCSKRPTEQMDVYSFGVVLLELITGRPAEQPDARESLDIVKWVRRKVNVKDGPMQVLDASIPNAVQREALGLLDVALRCTSVLPEKRPTIHEVLQSLQSLEYSMVDASMDFENGSPS